MTNLMDRVDGVTLTKVMSVSPNDDAKKAGESKKITIKVNFDGVTLEDVFQGAMSSEIIKAQNPLRKSYMSLEDGQVVERKYGERTPRQPMTKESAKMHIKTWTDEEKAALIAELEAELNN